jgi:hypothetical protein
MQVLIGRRGFFDVVPDDMQNKSSVDKQREPMDALFESREVTHVESSGMSGISGPQYATRGRGR